MTPSFLKQLFLICQFELKKLFLSRKGLLYLMTFAVVWYFILIYPIRLASNVLGQEQITTHGAGIFEYFGFTSLLLWQIPEFGVYWRFALLMFPALSLLIAADQTCSDRERGTLRFLALRVSRDGLFLGRFVSAVMAQVVLIIVTLLTTLALAIYRDSSLLTEAMNNVIIIALNLIIIVLPFTAMMAVLSAAVKSVRLVMVWAMLIWIFSAWVIGGLSAYWSVLEILKMLIPGYQLSALAQLSEWHTLQLAYIPLLQTLVLLRLGRWLMSRQSL